MKVQLKKGEKNEEKIALNKSQVRLIGVKKFIPGVWKLQVQLAASILLMWIIK